MTAYQGDVYQTQTGQWSWKITFKNIEVVSGSGYKTEDEAIDVMDAELVAYEESERRNHVQKMLVNFGLEGLKPSPEDELLHQAYIEGRATLTSAHNPTHAHLQTNLIGAEGLNRSSRVRLRRRIRGLTRNT